MQQKGDSSLKRESVKGSEERDRVWLMLLGPLNSKNMYYELNPMLLKRYMCACVITNMGRMWTDTSC